MSVDKTKEGNIDNLNSTVSVIKQNSNEIHTTLNIFIYSQKLLNI